MELKRLTWSVVSDVQERFIRSRIECISLEKVELFWKNQFIHAHFILFASMYIVSVIAEIELTHSIYI